MKPTRKITPPEWITAPQTQTVMRALNDPGARQTLFVGGCVRNELLGQPVGDIDMATIFSPDQVIERLQKANIHYAPTGIAHGTVTAIVRNSTFEITTLRNDVETDGRHAAVAFTRDWMEDAQRRDFTMNTLLADDEGNIYDPLGRGIVDLEAGRVIFVGDPKERIAEDYLRILRFFRFHALYGRDEPDSDALEACRDAAIHMLQLSRERITQEMMKILAVDDPAPVLKLMFDNDVALEFRSRRFDPQIFSRFCRLQRKYDAVDVMARLALLADLDYDRAGMLLTLSSAQNKSIRALVMMMRDNEKVSDRAIKRAIYEHDPNTVRQMLILHMMRDGEAPEYRRALQVAQTWTPPKFPLSGQDVLDLGIKPGPVLGQMLADVEDWWVGQDFAPDRAACLEKLRLSAQPL